MEVKKLVEKVLPVAGVVLTIGGSIISNIVQDKKTKETIAKLVDEKLAGK